MAGHRRATAAALAGALTLAPLAAAETPQPDPYLRYLETAPEFQPVGPPPGLAANRWNTWLYMPWRYRWTIGTGEAGGRFARAHGINGAVSNASRGPLPWFERWGFRFYNDHTAGKGSLYLNRMDWKPFQRDPRALRRGPEGLRPLDGELLGKLKREITRSVAKVGRSPLRVAYALDDEVSWGSFVVPLPWRVHGDDARYRRWLERVYGGKAPAARWVTPDDTRAQLSRPLAEIDLSPLLDRLSYNDSVWADFLGELVRHANRLDPRTPTGIVGAQSPNAWGGYDYAKLAGKLQFFEAYDLGSAQEILRSLAPDAPRVTAHFHRGGDGPEGIAGEVWQAWHYFAHGNRGMIGWVDGWFDGARPRPWLAAFAPTLRELGAVQGPKMAGARWRHDRVAIYYSHPSIQVSWCLDAEPHGETWVNRNNDHRLGTSHTVRRAWELLLTDAGLQYDFVAYDRVAVHGVPRQYRVLILPACYALSDLEARRIAEFATGGGTVIADFACGLFDQHGRGRRRGALDSLFGVRHDGTETRRDFFGGRLWVETDQEKGYQARRRRDLLATVDSRLHRGFAVAERRLPVATARRAGRGRAVYLNLSPQRYLQYRQEGAATAEHRRTFLDPVFAAGVRPWVRVTSGGRRLRDAEVTYWQKGGRTLLFALLELEVGGDERGGGGVQGLVRRKLPVAVELAAPVADVVDERTGRRLGDGRRFELPFDTAEAVFLSFRGGPPRP